MRTSAQLSQCLARWYFRLRHVSSAPAINKAGAERGVTGYFGEVFGEFSPALPFFGVVEGEFGLVDIEESALGGIVELCSDEVDGDV